MRYIHFVCLLLLSVLCPDTLHAQTLDLSVRRYSVADGLISNEVNDICQDDEGMIWCATNDGLARFDGYDFISFRSGYGKTDYLPSNTIIQISDYRDSLDVITPKGVIVFNKKSAKVERLKIPESHSSHLKSLCRISDNLLALGGFSGLFKYNSADSVFSRVAPSFGNINSMYRDSKGLIWLGTWNKGVYVWNPEQDSVEKIAPDLLPEDISPTRFLEDRAGNIYVSTWGNGLFCLENYMSGAKSSIQYTVNWENRTEKEDRNIIYDIEIDDTGNIWLATPYGLKIIKLADRRFIPYRLSENADFHEVKSICKGNNGIMWLAEYGKGLAAVSVLPGIIAECDPDTYGKKLISSEVTAVFRDRDHILWLGIRGNGFVRLDGDRMDLMKEIVPEIDIKSNCVTSFIESNSGDSLFLATKYRGVYLVEKNEKGQLKLLEHYSAGAEMSWKNFINKAQTDQHGNIWLATQAGITILRRDKKNKYRLLVPARLNSFIKNVPVETILIDSNNSLWVGTRENGIFNMDYRLETDTINTCRVYRVADGNTPSDRILSLYEDASNRIWAGTYGNGLIRYDRKENRFITAYSPNLFRSDVINSIAEDIRGNLWLATSNGIICINTLEENPQIKNFGAHDGIYNLSFLKNSCWSDGYEIIFGGYEGISTVNTSRHSFVSYPVSALVSDILLYNRSVYKEAPELRKRMLDFLPPYTENITLTHKEKSITFVFSASGNTASEMINYAYKLDGADISWNFSDSRYRSVTYSNLPPGKYSFIVRAADDIGNWNGENASVNIVVKPSPWLSSWAKSIYAMLSIIALISILYSVKHKIRFRRSLEIERMERQKSDEVNQAKLAFFTNVSHELFTPITIMSCTLEKAFADVKENTDMMRIFQSNLNRLMRLLQQLLEFRKAETSNLKLKVSKIDIAAFVRNLCKDNFEPAITDKNIHIEFNCSEESIFGYVDKDKLDKILYNLISNAYKYNRKNGKVTVAVSRAVYNDCDSVAFSVKDTGFGISEERKKDLFKRFYEGDYRRFNTKGTGIGLSLTKDLVDLHSGSINVNSEEGVGTEFTVILPIDRKVYREEQIEDLSLCGQLENCPKDLIHSPAMTKNDGAKYTLLIVDDNMELLAVMTELLKDKYNIHTAVNGVRALEILHNDNVDLVITDYVMPEMDGVELIRNIRNEFSFSHLPVIMLSAKLAVESKLESYRVGVDVYIDKPFEPSVLYAQIESTLSNREKLYRAYQAGNNNEINSLVNTEMDKEFLEKITRTIEENLLNPEFTNENLYVLLNMSKSTLYRKIKGLTGMSPKDYMKNIRFKYACKLLIQKTCNISEVAYKVGFSDAKYFSTCFKKEFGMTPSQYIKNIKKE